MRFICILHLLIPLIAADGWEVGYFNSSICAGNTNNQVYVDTNSENDCMGYNIPGSTCASIIQSWGYMAAVQCNFYWDNSCTDYVGEIDWCWGGVATPFSNPNVGQTNSFKCFWPSDSVGWCANL